MNAQPIQHGHCLCGETRLAARPKSLHVAACHCDLCRRWGGGPMMVVECEDVEMGGGDNLAIYASSDWAERGFCRQCGTHLFYRLKAGGYYAVPVGFFGDDTQWQLAEQVFIDSKPDYYAFAQKTRDLTGAELFAQFGAE